MEDMKPVVDETENWLDKHPGADREHVRKAVMEEFLDHIWGAEPMRYVITSPEPFTGTLGPQESTRS